MTESFVFILFIAAFLLLSCNSTLKEIDCDKYKTGHFEYHSKFDNSDILIDRNDSVQTETNSATGHFVKSKIKWTGKCEYQLTYFEQNTSSVDTIIPFVQSRPLKVAIQEVGKDYYIFKATMEGTDKSLVDTLRLIN